MLFYIFTQIFFNVLKCFFLMSFMYKSWNTLIYWDWSGFLCTNWENAKFCCNRNRSRLLVKASSHSHITTLLDILCNCTADTMCFSFCPNTQTVRKQLNWSICWQSWQSGRGQRKGAISRKELVTVILFKLQISVSQFQSCPLKYIHGGTFGNENSTEQKSTLLLIRLWGLSQCKTSSNEVQMFFFVFFRKCVLSTYSM